LVAPLLAEPLDRPTINNRAVKGETALYRTLDAASALVGGVGSSCQVTLICTYLGGGAVIGLPRDGAAIGDTTRRSW
jgi:hypothetical protein